MEDFLPWLDVIPGRSWLLLGPAAAGLAELVRRAYKPAGVTVAAEPAGFDASTFDVVVATEHASAAELRRLAVPAGMAAMLLAGEPAGLAREFRAAGLHAVQSRAIGELAAVRGTR